MELIGVPFDLCGKQSGSRLGPAAVRLANLVEVMASIGVEVVDGGDISVNSPLESDSPGLKNFQAGFNCILSLKKRVLRALESREVPLVVGGDHFVAAGSVSAAVEAYGEDLALVWIDAHADLNTPAGSPSGNLHGMPFAALLGRSSGCAGLPDNQWQRILDQVIPPQRLRPGRAGWFGIRELDESEQDEIRSLKDCYIATMHDVDRWGVVECLNKLDQWLRFTGAKKLWISFDVDVLDPLLAPGTGTAVRGGLTYREMHVFGEILYELLSSPGCPYSLAGLDLVEINPLSDTNNVTALTAVEWVASLFGKRILGPKI